MADASYNFTQQYGATGIVLDVLQPNKSGISESYTSTGLFANADTMETGRADAGNNPISLSQLQGGNYNGIFIVAGGQLQSPNFVSGSTGWQILSNGNVEFNNGTFRGALSANTIDIPNTTSANSFHVDANGNTWWGATTLANAVASITNAGMATFTSLAINGVTVGQVVTLVRDFTQSSAVNSSTAVKTYTLNGNTMGTTSAIRITVFVSANTTAGGARVRFGGNDLTAITFAAGATYDIIEVQNRGATNSQFYDGVNVTNGISPKVGSGTFAEDTTANLVIKLYDSGASGTFTVEGWVVELIK